MVPGSTSNLGPGFDALAVAVELYLRVEVLGASGRPDTIETTFAGARPPGENRIETAFALARERVGRQAAGLRIRVASDIPMAAGLGSSAAASVAGLRLYEIASGIAMDTDLLLQLAAELDGHPDNAAAALLGGIVLSCQTGSGRILARSWEWPRDIRFVVATPDCTLATSHARGVVPALIPREDAVANLQRALLFVRVLETGRYDDLGESLKDRWHQPARTPLVPCLAEALALEHPAVLGVCLSGAGPSIVALAAPGRSTEAAAALAGVYRRLGLAPAIRDLAAHDTPLSRLPVPLEERERTA